MDVQKTGTAPEAAPETNLPNPPLPQLPTSNKEEAVKPAAPQEVRNQMQNSVATTARPANQGRTEGDLESAGTVVQAPPDATNGGLWPHCRLEP